MFQHLELGAKLLAALWARRVGVLRVPLFVLLKLPPVDGDTAVRTELRPSVEISLVEFGIRFLRISKLASF